MSDRTIDRWTGHSGVPWPSEPRSVAESVGTSSASVRKAAPFLDEEPRSLGVLELLEGYRTPTRNQCSARYTPAEVSTEPRIASPSADTVQNTEHQARGASDGADGDSTISTIATWVNEHPRLMGSLKTVGGAAETLAGGAAILAPEPTALTKVVGVAAVAHGLDTLQSGFHQLVSGASTRTLTSDGLQLAAESMGADPEQAAVGAELADAALGMGLSLGAGALSSTANAATVIKGQGAVANLPEDANALQALRSWWLRGAEGDEAWRASSASEKFFYEIGQKTLTDANWARFGHITDPVERGRAMWEAQGIVRATVNEGHGIVWGAGKTLDTGPTPGLRWLAQDGAAVVGASGSLSKAGGAMSRTDAQ